jgi:hypothetical protein
MEVVLENPCGLRFTLIYTVEHLATLAASGMQPVDNTLLVANFQQTSLPWQAHASNALHFTEVHSLLGR